MVITGGLPNPAASGPLVDVPCGQNIHSGSTCSHLLKHGDGRSIPETPSGEDVCAASPSEPSRGRSAAAAAVAQLVVCRSRHIHSELERGGASNLGLILSAFEQLKTGRRVEYQVLSSLAASQASPVTTGSDTRPVLSLLTVTDAPVDSGPQMTTSRSRESSEEVGSASAADSSGSTHGRSRGGSVSMGELRNRPNRDDRAASELGLPVSAEEIVNMPVEEFNSFVSGQSLTLNQEQIQLMKDIRRRGKNKVAAQNCRRRKIDNMSHLEREIYNLRQDLAQATARRDEAARQREMYRSALANPVSVVQSSGPQQSVHGSFGQNHVSVLVAPASANAQGDQPSNKRIARDTTSDQLRKRKRDA